MTTRTVRNPETDGLTPKETALILGISMDTLIKDRKRKPPRIPFIRLPGYKGIRYWPNDVEAAKDSGIFFKKCQPLLNSTYKRAPAYIRPEAFAALIGVPPEVLEYDRRHNVPPMVPYWLVPDAGEMYHPFDVDKAREAFASLKAKMANARKAQK